MKAHFAVVAVLASLCCGPALAQPAPSLAVLSVEQLRSLSLHCDAAASNGRIDTATMTFCTMAADELRKRGFSGNVDAMLSRWRGGREVGAAAISSAPAAKPDR